MERDELGGELAQAIEVALDRGVVAVLDMDGAPLDVAELDEAALERVDEPSR